MKLPLALILSCGLALSAQAFAPHPSVLTVQYEGQMLPVTKVIGTDPIVEVGGKEKRIRRDPIYLLQRAETFSSDWVKLLRISLDLTHFAIVASQEDDGSTAPLFGTSYFEAALQSKNTIKGGFAAIVIFYIETKNGTPTIRSQVIVHDLPDLIAGEETPIKITAALAGMRRDLQYFLLVFDGSGREVLTSNMDPSFSYFALLERIQLKDALPRYLAKHVGENVAVTPVMMARPIFPEGVVVPKSEVSALLAISADGNVSDIQLNGDVELPAYKCIVEALAGWLFFPQLKDGVPVPTKVKVPLQF